MVVSDAANQMEGLLVDGRLRDISHARALFPIQSCCHEVKVQRVEYILRIRFLVSTYVALLAPPSP